MRLEKFIQRLIHYIKSPCYGGLLARGTAMQADVDAEVSNNFKYFQGVVASLIAQHAGQFALIKNCQIRSYHPTSAQALVAGYQGFPDGIFSVQEVITKPLDLGFYSHVADHGKD
jgi:hypothetical protein